jgi:hypothetical protein
MNVGFLGLNPHTHMTVVGDLRRMENGRARTPFRG